MSESASTDRHFAFLLAYILEERDKSTFASATGDKFDIQELIQVQDRQIPLPKPECLSPAQIFLLGFLTHLYAAFYSKDFIHDPKLKDIRASLRLSEDFVTYAFTRIRMASPNSLLKGRQPIECVMDPDASTARWILDIVYSATRDGLFFEKESLINLEPAEYEHPSDKLALDALQSTTGLDIMVNKIMELGFEYYLKLPYICSNIRVSPGNFPSIHRALITVCKNLNMPIIPELYMKTGFIDAGTIGLENPLVFLTIGTIALFDYDELLFVIGHEVGHIKSKHNIYFTMDKAIDFGGDALGNLTLGLSQLISKGTLLAIRSWMRKSELTADRAGLLACQNPDAAIKVMMKMAGVPVKFYNALNKDEFLKQAKDLEGLDIDVSSKIAKTLVIMDRAHPWLIYRAAELQKWIESGDYQRIIDQRKNARINTVDTPMPERQIALDNRFCTKCGTAFRDEHKFCTTCGALR